ASSSSLTIHREALEKRSLLACDVCASPRLHRHYQSVHRSTCGSSFRTLKPRPYTLIPALPVACPTEQVGIAGETTTTTLIACSPRSLVESSAPGGSRA